MVLRANELQLTRGESVRDTALVFSRHVAAIGLRTSSDERLEELAEHATVPVVNLLSPRHHPCQALADLMTLREAFGAIEGRRLAYVGDGNNVARSLAIVGALAGVEVAVAAPEGYQLEDGARRAADDRPGRGRRRRRRRLHRRLGLDERRRRRGRRAPRGARPYRLDEALLDRAAPHAFALHCLPAHPGEEITEGVLYGDRQRIWDQAENRRHVSRRCSSSSSPGRCCGHVPRASRPAAAVAVQGVHRAQGVRDVAPDARPTPTREQLQRFLDPREVVVVTRERLQEALDEAVDAGA